MRSPQAAESKMRRSECIEKKKSAPNRFYFSGPIKRNSINNYDFLKFMISVWGGPWATKYLSTPLGTHAVLSAVISPEQRKYSQQGQEFFLITVLICGPLSAEARLRSQANFCGIERSFTVTDFSHSSSVFSPLSHYQCSTFIFHSPASAMTYLNHCGRTVVTE